MPEDAAEANTKAAATVQGTSKLARLCLDNQADHRPAQEAPSIAKRHSASRRKRRRSFPNASPPPARALSSHLKWKDDGASEKC